MFSVFLQRSIKTIKHFAVSGLFKTFIFSYMVIKNETINSINYIRIVTKHEIHLPTNRQRVNP